MNSFSTWRQLNESLRYRENNPNKGKEIIFTEDGRKQIVKYKIQTDSKFLIKLIRNASIIDSEGNLTSVGADKILEFINNQPEIVNVIGNLDNDWFKDKILIYTVKRDTQSSSDGGKIGREKIQFTILNRSDLPKLPPNERFVNSSIAEASGSEENAAELSNIIKDNIATAERDNTVENPKEITQGGDKETQVEETQDDDLIGKKFRYSMRTNNKLYLMEFMSSGSLQADVIGIDSNPNGVVSYENNDAGGTVNWTTDEDDRLSREDWKLKYGTAKLFTDQEIENKIDREFFIKIFTNEEYRNKVISDYEAEYGSTEMTPENIKKMLYYQDGTKIFPESGTIDRGELSAEEKEIESSGSYSGGGTYTGQVI
jgi:hypothetical protein